MVYQGIVALVLSFIVSFHWVDADGGVLPVADESVAVRNLSIGMRGEDVRALQTFLINRRQRIAAGATGYFGEQTQAALVSYQAASGIAPAAGYFGPKTRTHIETLGVEVWW